MYCKQCGANVPEGADFCQVCGTPVPKQPYQKPAGGNHIIAICAIAAAAVVLVVGIVCFTILQKDSGTDKQLAALDSQSVTAGTEQESQSSAAAADSKDTASSTTTDDTAKQESTKDDAADSTATTSTVNNYYYYGASAYRDDNYYTATGDWDYLWPSDSQYISASDLSGLSKDTVAAIRNEVYARHGYAFQTERWRAYFAAKSWYRRDNSCTESNIRSRLSSLERSNIDTIVAYEESMGWR